MKLYVDKMPKFCAVCPYFDDDYLVCNISEQWSDFEDFDVYEEISKKCPLNSIQTLLAEKEKEQNQKAIEQLEEVKTAVKYFCELHSDEFYGVKSQVIGINQDVCEYIDQQIKQIRGE